MICSIRLWISFDSKGNLIGINTAIYTQTGKYLYVFIVCCFFLKMVGVMPEIYISIDSLWFSLYLCTYVDNIIFGVTGTSTGVGFAIPSSTVTRIMPQLIQYGKVCSMEIQLNVWNGALVLQVVHIARLIFLGVILDDNGILLFKNTWWFSNFLFYYVDAIHEHNYRA